MSDLVTELAERGRTLSPVDRSRLVEMLLESLHEQPLDVDVERAWAAEIARRVASYERGEEPTFSAEEVFAEARRIAP